MLVIKLPPILRSSTIVLYILRSQSLINIWLFKLSTVNILVDPEFNLISLLYIEILASGEPNRVSLASGLIWNSSASKAVNVRPILLIYPTNPEDTSVPTETVFIS